MARIKAVKAWAIVKKNGEIRGKWVPSIFYDKSEADRNVFQQSERVIPVEIVPVEEKE